MTPRKKTPHDGAVRHLTNADERLAKLIARVGPCLLSADAASTAERRFHGLVEAIVAQQLSPKAATTIFGRVCALGVDQASGTLSPGLLLAHPEARLREAGLSTAKARYVRDLAARVEGRSLDLSAMHDLDDEAVIEALCEVKGIGRWTAEMFLMFQLGRPDILPVGDLGIQKGMKALYGLRALPKPERMEKLARPLRPYRSIACWYLWRLRDTDTD